MPINQREIKRLSAILPPREVAEIVRLATAQDKLENQWILRLEARFNELLQKVVRSLVDTGKLPEDLPELDAFFVNHAFSVIGHAINIATHHPETIKRLAAPPKGSVPKNLRDLMTQWDKWRTQGKIPVRQKVLANKVKRAYLDGIKSVWDRHAEDFKEGKVFDQSKIIEAMKKATKASESRAKMIINTETTRYYNEVRTKIYNANPDITHYLYVPVRDFATTAWCFNGTRPGARGRGRGGLVFEKGTELMQRNTPSVHWNCRSELLPLTPLNPNHKKLINDKSLRAENHKLQPLPPGWNV
jgi:SPP1 gp7 family putative phage head morphogenesis protein